MKHIYEFADYNNTVILPRGVVLSNLDRMTLCKIISGALNQYYKIDKVQGEYVDIDGVKLEKEILSKMINNRTVLKRVIIQNRNIKTKDDLINFIKDNLYDMYHYDGKFFDENYFIVSNTTKSGKKSENAAYKAFEEVAKRKGLNIEVLPPDSVEEDKSGIDGYFIHNGKKFTIQVKPLHKLEEYRKDNTFYCVFCDGMLQDIKTDYLVVTRDNISWVFKGKGITRNKGCYIIPKINLIK